MMKILHGDNQIQSREVLVQEVAKAKVNDWEVITFEGKEGRDWDLGDLKQALEAQSLFGQERLVVIEKWLGKLQARSKSEALDYLVKASPENVVSWDDKQLTAGILKKFKGVAAQEFKLPTVMFTFLDSFGSGNEKRLLNLLQEICQSQPSDMVLALLTRRVRQLLLLSEGEEVLKQADRVAPWQIGKLRQQLRGLSQEKLLKLYEEFMEYDYARKTSRSMRESKEQLEWWILNL